MIFMGRVKSFFEIIRHEFPKTGMRTDEGGTLSSKKRRKFRKEKKVSVMFCGIWRNLWNGDLLKRKFEEQSLCMKAGQERF